MSAGSRAFLRKSRADVAKNPEKYTSRRILSSVDRSRGTTRQDITDQAIAVRDAKSSPVEPGVIGGIKVIEPAHTSLSSPALSPHLSSPVNPFIHSRPASDLSVHSTTIKESIEQAKDRSTPKYTPEEQTLRSQIVGGGSETLMYSPDQRANLMESIHQKSPYTIANKKSEGDLSGATSNADISQFSMGIHDKASDISDTIKAGIPELKERTGAAGVVLQYPVNFIARSIEAGGMVIGGSEVLLENPGAIMPALSVGAYQSTFGTVKAFEENPLQVISDFATVSLFNWGLGAVIGGVRGGPSRIPYSISKKATLPEGIMLKKTINVPTDTAPITKPTDIVPYGPKEQLTFAGTPKGGMVDIYVKVPKGSEAEALSSISGDMQTISTPSGKMLQISDVHSSSTPTTSAVKTIGGSNKITLSDLVPSDMSPFEIIKKVDMDPIDISTQNVPKRTQITEYGAAYETNAIPDPQLGPGYKPNNLVKPITDLPVEINTKPTTAESIKLLSQGDAIVAPSGMFEPRPISFERLFDTSPTSPVTTSSTTPKLFNPAAAIPDVFSIADVALPSSPSAPHTQTKAQGDIQLQEIMQPELKPSQLQFKDPDLFDISSMMQPVMELQIMPKSTSNIESLMSTSHSTGGRKTSSHKSNSPQFNPDPKISTFNIKQPTTRGNTAKDRSTSFGFGRIQVPETSNSPFTGINPDPFPNSANLPKDDPFEDIFRSPHKHRDPHPSSDNPINISPAPPILEPTEIKFSTTIKSNPRSRSKSKNTPDGLDIFDKNLFNKYNDPLKTGAAVDVNVQKMLKGVL